MGINLGKMYTESRNTKTMNLDTMTPLEIVKIMNSEDAKIPACITPVLPEIAQCVQWASKAIEEGGRIVYMGAGTSGRLGVLDAVECPPTFGVSPDVVVGLIAGGEKAFVRAVEGAEDSRNLGREDLGNIHIRSSDIVIGLAASGRTPYVLGGLEYAKKVGCHTVAIACNLNSEIGAAAELAIEVSPGAEVLTGSTRLKAGTCQKMILNMISTATMVRCGKAYENLMVDVIQNNEKLRIRARNIVMEATGCDEERAAELLLQGEGSAKTAILIELAGCSAEAAKESLEKARGHIRRSLEMLKK